MIPEPLRVLLEGAEFRAALPFGLAACGVGAAAGVAWKRTGRRGPAPIGGVLVAVAAALALSVPVSAPRVGDPDLPEALAAGLALLAAAGVIVDAAGWPVAVAVLAGTPGAWLVSYRSGLVDVAWVGAAVAVASLGGGVLAATVDRRPGWPGLGPALFALSTVGVYFTVPDTEEAMVLVAVAGPLALLGWPLRLTTLGTGGAMAAVGLLAWTIAAGGYGRETSIVGGLACFGLLVLEPLGRWAARRRPPDHRSAGSDLIVLSSHLALVYVASRVVGLRLRLAEALVLAGGLAVAGVAGVVLAARA